MPQSLPSVDAPSKAKAVKQPPSMLDQLQATVMQAASQSSGIPLSPDMPGYDPQGNLSPEKVRLGTTRVAPGGPRPSISLPPPEDLNNPNAVPGWNPNWGPAPQSVIDQERRKRAGILGPYASPELEPTQGIDRLQSRMTRPPSYAAKPYTHDWDQWLLTLPWDGKDPDYNSALARERQGALDRERKRGQDINQSAMQGSPNVQDQARQQGLIRGITGEVDTAPNAADEAKGLLKDQKIKEYTERVTNNPEPIVLNAYGEPVDPKKTLGVSGGRKSILAGSSTTEALTNALTTDENGNPAPDAGALTVNGPIDVKTLRASGKVVFVGNKSHTGAYGVTYDQPMFMSVNDAMLIPASWSPQVIANFQHSMKQKVTGYVDPTTLTNWQKIINTSNYYAQAGMPVGINDVLNMALNGGMPGASGSSSGGSGGGGGGGGGRSGGSGGGGGGGGSGGSGGGVNVPAGQARTYLNQFMQKYAGREANDAESAAFAKAINAAAGDPNFSAQDFALQWVRGRIPSETGTFQAATDYYSAIQQVLGGGAV